MLLLVTGDSKSELTIVFVVGLVGSPPPGIESVLPAAIVRFPADALSPGRIVTVAPLVEETIFRGYIYPGLARSWGIPASVIVTGTLFGLMHAPQLWGGWLQIALLILVGIAFTYARAATRTVVTSYLLHVSYNSFLFLTFLIGSHWLRPMHPGH